MLFYIVQKQIFQWIETEVKLLSLRFVLGGHNLYASRLTKFVFKNILSGEIVFPPQCAVRRISKMEKTDCSRWKYPFIGTWTTRNQKQDSRIYFSLSIHGIGQRRKTFDSTMALLNSKFKHRYYRFETLMSLIFRRLTKSRIDYHAKYVNRFWSFFVLTSQTGLFQCNFCFIFHP